MNTLSKFCCLPRHNRPSPKSSSVDSSPDISGTSNDMSSSSLLGKVALITGGSKGIGKATAIGLARAGAHVVINYSSDSSAAEELVQQIGSDRAYSVKANVGSVHEIESLVRHTVDKFGKIDILIPNAGIMPMKDLEATTEQDFDQTFGLNVKGPYFLVQKAAPYMASGSHIIFLSTSLTTASTVTPNYLLYVSSKGAIEQMTRVISKDLARKGVCVNAVAPGPTGTELFYKGKPESLLKTIAGFNPQNRIGTPEEVADAIIFLSGGGSRWISGQVINANGGMA